MAGTDGSLPVTEKPSVVQHIADGKIPATSMGEAGIEGGSEAQGLIQYDKLKEYYRQAEKYGTGSIKELEDGRIRFYEKLKPANRAGEMAGSRHVREWNPDTGATRDWYETLDHYGNIRQVRPDPDVTGGIKVHYMFDTQGNYTDKWSPKPNNSK